MMYLAVFYLWAKLLTYVVGASPANRTQPNILFIISEDLRPELPVYGRQSIAPNLQRLADLSTVFDLALCQVSVCAPSRASILTGLRPETLGIYDFSYYGGLNRFRTIPSHFHRHGYTTANAGKLFHWESSRYYSGMYWGSPQWEAVQRHEMKRHIASVTPDEESPEKGFFRDAIIVSEAVKFLRSLAATQQPWFLSVGLKGTHMQYQMPKRFWDMYEHTDFVVNQPGSLHFPKFAPLVGHVRKTESTVIHYRSITSNNDTVRSAGSLREAYQRQGNGLSISQRGWKELYRGYLACLTYTDELLGDLWAELDSLGLWATTVVVFTSDHGMHVGEKVSYNIC